MTDLEDCNIEIPLSYDMKTCTCPHEYKSYGKLYGIPMGEGWIRIKDKEDCPIHGVS